MCSNKKCLNKTQNKGERKKCTLQFIFYPITTPPLVTEWYFNLLLLYWRRFLDFSPPCFIITGLGTLISIVGEGVSPYLVIVVTQDVVGFVPTFLLWYQRSRHRKTQFFWTKVSDERFLPEKRRKFPHLIKNHHQNTKLVKKLPKKGPLNVWNCN